MKAKPCCGELRAELVEVEIGAETGNGFELIQRAAGVAQRAAGNHGNDDARGRGQRRRDQAGFVAHAAGGVLVDFNARDGGEVDCFAGLHHALGEGADFAVGHAGEKHGHKEGGGLIVGNGTVGITVYDVGDLFGGQFFAVPFPVNQVDSAHESFERNTLFDWK